MIWSFLEPVFLWGAAAAVVPLILHLMQRRRAVTILFGTVRFLKLAQRRSANRIRMEHFLLWLLRTLVLLALALAFAGPILRATGWGSWVGRSRRDVALVVDASFSMGYEKAGRTVWKEAVEAAAAVIDGLEEGDRVCVFLAGEDALPLVEQLSADREFAKSALRKAEMVPGPSRLRPAILAAGAALKDSPGERELFVFTDGQALPWNEVRDQGVALPEERMAVFVTRGGAPSPENDTPRDVAVEPPLLVAGAPVRVKASVQSTGPDRPVTATLAVDGAPADRREARGGAAEFTLPGLAAGWHEAWLETGADSLSVDNRLHFLLHVREEIAVLVVGSPDDAFFLGRALNPSEAFTFFKVTRVEKEGVADERLDRYACVIALNAAAMPGASLLKLEQYVREGGVLAVFPGEADAPAAYGGWSVLPAKPRELAEVPPEQSRYLLRLAKPDDPIFASLKLPAGSVPAIVAKKMLLWGERAADAEDLLVAGADRPFLLARTVDRGRVLQCAVSADRRWSNLPLTSLFVPLVHQMVLAASEQGQGSLQQTLKDRVVLDRAPAVEGDSAAATDPEGQARTLRLREEGGRKAWTLDGARLPGVYRLSAAAGAGVPLVALNLDRRESDLTALTGHALAALPVKPAPRVAGQTADLAGLIAEHRIGRPMAEPLLWAALVLSLLEVVLANWLTRPTRSLADTLAVDATGRVHAAEREPA